MNSYTLIPILEVVFSFGLLALLLISGRRHLARRPFAFFLVFMGLWGFFIFMMRASSSLEFAFFWEKMVFVAISSAALFFYRFTISLTGIRQPKAIVYPVHIFYLIVLGLIPTGLVVSGMQMMWYGKAPIIGPAFFPFVVGGVYTPLVLGMRVLLKHYRQSTILSDKIRDSYIIAGIILMFIGGTTDYLPALGISMYPLGIIGNILFCMLATIAMLRYGLLEMKVVLRKGVAYSLVSMVVFGIFASLIFLLSIVFRELVNPVSLTIAIITVFATAAAFQPLLSKLQQRVDRWFFRERYDNLQALKRFPAESKDLMDLTQLTKSVVSVVAQSMGSRSVYLLLPSPDTGNLVTYSHTGENGTPKPQFSDSSMVTQTMKYHDGLIDFNDIDIIPSMNNMSNSDRKKLERTQVELLVPLKNAMKLVGILLLCHKSSGEHYSMEDRRLLQTVSQEVALTIDNARLYDNVRQEHEKLQQTMEGVVHAMSLTVEARDPYTAGHQRRVADLACAIATEMGFPEWQIEGLRITGLLHDVGKLVVPAEILSKPGRISQYEFSIIKTHPEVAHEILKGIEFPWPVTETILQHHERLDGSGYPAGLSGDDINLEARVLTVADVVEAMSSHRPYRPALGVDKALEEISKGRGVLYDATVVDACLKLFRAGNFDFEELATTSSFK